MSERLAAFVSRWWLGVLGVWVVVALALHTIAPRWDDVTNDGDLAYLPATCTSVRGEQLLSEAFPGEAAKSQIVLVVERSDGPLTAQDLAVVDRLGERFQPDAAHGLPITGTWTRREKLVGRKLLSPARDNGQAALVVLFLRNEFMATDNIRVLDALEGELRAVRADAAFPAGLRVGLTGSAAIGGDMLDSARESIDNIELSAVLLVMVILLVVYRAPLLVLIPVTIMVLSTWVAMDLVAWATQWRWLDFQIFKTTKIFVVVVLFGSGTDYCLFLISRFKEELQHGFDRHTATHRALSQVGGALLGSALTTIFGLAMMYFAEFGKFRNSGPVIAVCLSVTLLASLTLAPAMLRAMGSLVYWPMKLHPAALPGAAAQLPLVAPKGPPGSDFWAWTARAILARPGTILVGACVLLAPLAVVGWDVPLTYDLLHELQHDRPSVAGTAMLTRHFPGGEIGPVTLVAVDPQRPFDDRAGERRIAQLTRWLYDAPGVVSVRSLTEPLGERPFVNPLKLTKAAARKHPRARELYLATGGPHRGHLTKFELLLHDDPFSQASTEKLLALEERLATLRTTADSPWHGVRFELAGTTAAKRDLQSVTERDQRRIQVLVTLAVGVVLLGLLKRPVVCAFLIASVLLGYFATMGITELAFTWLYGQTFVGLDWKVPLFLFVILVAIGEDYNIYMVTRVLEEQQQHGLRGGLRRAVSLTGGIISSCGVIMAGSFVSMMTGTLRGIVELGFALSLGILLDTFVIRPILVPAFLAYLDRRRPEPPADWGPPVVVPPALETRHPEPLSV